MRMNDPAAPPGDDSFGDRGNVIDPVSYQLRHISFIRRQLSGCCLYVSIFRMLLSTIYQ